MKKAYVKPEIMFEDFSLNNSIAAGCEKISQQTENICAYTIVTSAGAFSIFTSQVSGDVCSTTKADGEYNGLCYHVPEAGNNVFTS